MLSFIIMHAIVLVKISKHIIVDVSFLTKHRINFSLKDITDFELFWGENTYLIYT